VRETKLPKNMGQSTKQIKIDFGDSGRMK